MTTPWTKKDPLKGIWLSASRKGGTAGSARRKQAATAREIIEFWRAPFNSKAVKKAIWR